MRYFTTKTLLDYLRAKLDHFKKTNEIKTRKAFAHKYNLDDRYLGDVLAGRRGMSPKMAQALGFVPVVMWRTATEQELARLPRVQVTSRQGPKPRIKAPPIPRPKKGNKHAEPLH